MKRYLVFSGYEWDPGGGWVDFDGTADDLEAARQIAHTSYAEDCTDWWHIVDTEAGEIVDRS